MSREFDAVYENGVFRPLTRPEGIAENWCVTLTVAVEERSSFLADLAGRISADDAHKMRAIVERAFGRVDS
jgi:predicted DNA-binding antitoxin AbrB/MazE fold protein